MLMQETSVPSAIREVSKTDPKLHTTSRTVSECCVLVFVETWLNDSVPDCAIQLARLTCYRVDRALVEGGGRLAAGDSVFTSAMPGVATLLWSANTAHHWWSCGN